MNTKPVFFLCFLCALLLISVVATEPSKDETQGNAYYIASCNCSFLKSPRLTIILPLSLHVSLISC